VSVTRSNNSQVLLTKKNVHTISRKRTSSDNVFFCDAYAEIQAYVCAALTSVTFKIKKFLRTDVVLPLGII